MKVVQCWDDGVVNDARLVEMLRHYGAKATFNLNIGLMNIERIPSGWLRLSEGWSHRGFRSGKLGLKEIRQIYDGFEVASHCWRHENAGEVPDELFLKSALDVRTYLEDLFEKPCRGFAWPCGRYTDATCKLLHEAGFAYGRTTKNCDDPAACADKMALHSNCHFQDPNFLAKYNKAKADGVKFFYFWGHSYEMFEYDPLWEQLEQKIRMITEDPDAEWANVIDVVE